MSRRYNIRWNKADEAELKRVVKNFNAKLTRLEKKDPLNKNALPERVSAAQLRGMIDTRQDLNRELNSLRRFTERGAEELIEVPGSDYNLKLTKWQRREMSIRAGIVNRKRKEQRERIADIEMSSRGEKLGYTRGQIGMGKAEEHELADVKEFLPSMNRRDLNKRFALLRKQSSSMYWEKRNEIMRTNYIEQIERNFPAEMVSDIIGQIRDMDFGEFRKIFEAEDQHKFEFNYPLNSEQQQEYSSALRAIWKPNK